MSSWLLVGMASAFWGGLLARPFVGDGLPVWAWLCAAAALFAAAVMLSPNRHDDLLATVDPSPRPLAIVGPSPSGSPRTPRCVVLATIALGTSLLAVGWGGVHAHRVAGSALIDVPGRVTVQAVLRTDPHRSSIGWTAVADVRHVRLAAGAPDASPTDPWIDGIDVDVRESVWLRGLEDPPAAVRGDRVEIEGSVDRPEDGDDFASFLDRRGIAVVLEADEVVRLGPSDSAIVRWAQAFRTVVGDAVRELFPRREAGLLLGLALGDDTGLDPTLERDFRASGLSHLLVVSGGNVAMILGPVVALGVLLRLPRWARFALGLATVVFFVAVTGAEPSVLRAGVMAGLGLLGVLLGRPRSTAAVLAGAVLLLLVLDPTLVWSVGFQLSVVATAGMVALATPLADRMRPLPRPVALAAGATLAAQTAVTPLLLFHFHEVPTSTIAANVVAFPAVAPAMLLGLSAAVASLAWAPAGRFLAAMALAPLRYLEAVADRAARAPAPWITGGGLATLVLGLALAAGIAWWLRAGRRVPRRTLIAAVVLVPVVVWSNALTSGVPESLTVRFFDVGQGDAALLTSPGGAAILVDGGPDEAQVATELAALGVKRLDLLVASHPHADHIVGIPAVLSRVPVALLLQPGCEDDSADLAELDAAVRAEGIPVEHPRAGDRFEVGDVVVEILSPDRCWSGTESDANNDAIVLRASIGQDSILFATEPEEPAQQVLLDSGVDLSSDVLKVPHHGAATSIRPFFDAARSAIAVVSVGPNTYGHPVPEVLEWIRATGAAVLRTDLAGDVIVRFADHRVLVDSAS